MTLARPDVVMDAREDVEPAEVFAVVKAMFLAVVEAGSEVEALGHWSYAFFSTSSGCALPPIFTGSGFTTPGRAGKSIGTGTAPPIIGLPATS